MLLSNAIALAQEGCCFDWDPASFPSSASGHEAFKQQWNQLICVFLYLADESLATRLGLDTLLPDKASNVVRSRFSVTFASLIPDGALWESYYDLSTEIRKARELLLSMKKGGSALSNAKLLPELQHIDRALSRWRRQHAYSGSGMLPRLSLRSAY